MKPPVPTAGGAKLEPVRATTAYSTHERHPHRRDRPHRGRDRARAEARGDAVTVLSAIRPARAPRSATSTRRPGTLDGPAPAAALSGRDAVVDLAGESVAQRWTDASRRAIRDSRELGTRNLVAGLRAAEPRPRVLVSASGVDYYGPRGDERVTEDAAPGDDFLAAGMRRVGARGRTRRESSGCAWR